MEISRMNWKPVLNFEGIYLINEEGVIKSLKRRVDRGNKPSYIRKERLLKTSIDRYGYKKVTLFKNKKRYYYTVHRQVALAFIDNPHNLPEVNHKDGNKLNNNKTNLEWCTGLYNSNHAHKNGLIDYSKTSGTNHYNTNLTEENLKEIKKLLSVGVKQIEISKKFNTSRSAISRIKLGITYK